MYPPAWAIMLGLLATTGCASASQHQARGALRHVRHAPTVALTDANASSAQPHFDGKLSSYLSYALRHNPTLHASRARWQAEVARIDSMYALPEPSVRYSVFLRPVETRVGPQRHRVAINQTFPWPTVIEAGVEGASFAARAAAQRYEADALLVTEHVADAYWRLWLLAREAQVLKEHAQLLVGLSEAAQARLVIGNAGLSHVTQVQLAQSRLHDLRAGLTRSRRRHSASLREAVSVATETAMPIAATSPTLAAPAESANQLRAAVQRHPRLGSIAFMALSKRSFAERAEAEGLPRLSIGAQWIEVGAARSGTSADGKSESGNDALSLSVGLSIPLWRGVYRGRRDAALADARALEADRAAAGNHALAQLERLIAEIDDTKRRASLYRNTLIPQAQTALEASLGEYQVGQTALANALLAIRDLFELQLGRDRAAARHRQAWAKLEAVVGRKVHASVEVAR